jgi:hypothetical protein
LYLKLALTVVVCICLHACMHLHLHLCNLYSNNAPRSIFFDFSFLDPVLFFLMIWNGMQYCHFLNDVLNVFSWNLVNSFKSSKDTDTGILLPFLSKKEKHCLHPVFVCNNNNNNDGPVHSPIHVISCSSVYMRCEN